MTEFNLADFLPYQINELSRAVSAGFSRHYREKYGITIAEWRVVAHLSQQAEVSVREITAKVGMDKPKVSRAASRLEAAGYVTKVEDPTDRRLVKLALTDKGREMIETLAPIAREYDEALWAAIRGTRDDFAASMEALRAAAREKTGENGE